MAKKNKTICPCGSGEPYQGCCGKYLEGSELPHTPEQLMRSRYTAYCLKNDTYILDTWHASTRPESLHAENNLPVKWVGLEVLNAPVPEETDNSASVEFTAQYKVGGKAETMHEVSKFVKEAGRWFYLKGQVN